MVQNKCNNLRSIPTIDIDKNVPKTTEILPIHVVLKLVAQ
jgi:hypothetical protein